MNTSAPVDETDKAPYSMAHVFLFKQMPALDDAGGEGGFAQRLAGRLAAQAPLVSPLTVGALVEQDGQIHVLIGFDRHQFRLIGFAEPTDDDSVDRAIQCSHWPAEQKQAIRDHGAHLVCFYLGEHEDPGEQIIATHRLAAALVPESLTGSVDPEAWNCVPAPALGEITQPASIGTFRESMPAGLWTGFVKLLISETEVWFCTKGMHRWNLPDLAMFGSNEESQQIADRFFAFCNYAIAAPKPFAVGEVADLGPDERFMLGPVTEYAEYLDSPCGTLVMQPLAPD